MWACLLFILQLILIFFFKKLPFVFCTRTDWIMQRATGQLLFLDIFWTIIMLDEFFW